jgi:4-diphosphocytidyl-2-C-methyl-D-erythritol kinase
MTTLRAEAFAKTNLVLKILGKREDGYHEIDTIFQTIDLTDVIEASTASDGIELACSDPAIPAGESNLVHRAATAWRDRFGVREGARLRLIKRIPAGGGLGGGSSDAAVTLGLLSRLWHLAPTDRDFAEVGASLGSDVPFFFVGGTARGRGRGEIIEPLLDRPPRELILIVPPFSIATRDVYARWRPDPASSPGGTVFGANDLASAVLAVSPEMNRYRQAISRLFPDCQISGSGASLIAAPAEGRPDDLAALRTELPEAKILQTRTISRAEYGTRSTPGPVSLPRR